MIVSDYYMYNIVPLTPKIYSTIAYAITKVMSFFFKYCR